VSKLPGLRLLPVLAAVMVGCDLPGRPDPADRPVPADQVTDFGTLYATHCAGCHGADGKLGPAPPLNDPIFLAIVPDEELLMVITEGRAVTPAQKSPMPAFARSKGGPLTDAQVSALAEGIKKRWGPGRAEAQSLPPYYASTDTNGANKDAGARVFVRACAGCHGNHGQGGKDGERQVGALNNQAFLALTSDQALRRYVITGRSDLGMPAFDGSNGRPPEFRALSSVQIDDLVALLAHWRQAGPDNNK
jgi:cytochrome c oxidase cbb3-type subunit 3/ubiquinol-cytochrome c reductase cytochrome c subunit